MQVDLHRHKISEAQDIISVREDLLLRVPTERPEVLREEVFHLLMDRFAVPHLNHEKRPFACILYWPPLDNPSLPEPDSNLLEKIPTLYDPKAENAISILTIVWEFFMGSRVPDMYRVVQSCAGSKPEGGPYVTRCMNINHLGLAHIRDRSRLTSTREQALYRRLVKGESLEAVAMVLGIMPGNIVRWTSDLSKEERQAYSHQRTQYALELAKHLSDPNLHNRANAKLLEAHKRQRRAEQLKHTGTLGIDTKPADPVRHLPLCWFPQPPEAKRDPAKFYVRASGLLIGRPPSRDLF